MSGIELHPASGRIGFVAADGSAARAPETPSADYAPFAVKLGVVFTRGGFDALEAEWKELEGRVDAAHQVFQSFNWSWHWCNHYLPKAGGGKPCLELAVVTGRMSGRLVMVWPLVLEHVIGLRILRWLGEPVSQYGDALVEHGPHRHELLAAGYDFALRRLAPDVVHLANVRADAVAAPLLQAEDVSVIAAGRAPFNDLQAYASYCDFEKALAGKDKKSRRRHRRRLGEKGAVRAEIMAEGAEARAFAARAVRMKREWLEARGLSSRAFADNRIEAFMAEVAGDERRPVGCRIGVLTCAGQTTAIEIVFRNAAHAVSHIKVYAPEFEMHGPGHLLTEDLIQSIFYEGAATYDLMAPDAAYKWIWADQSVPVREHALARTRRGRLYVSLYLKRMRPKLKAALGKLPMSVRRRLLRARQTAE
ncbi:MAG: GNAT family N-acetyltransferase [Hyphomicrobiaceae bacterium]|nr:MAG: GNAT family N-acetyltransferase [Hyphomicrobiaceae bacterium]